MECPTCHIVFDVDPRLGFGQIPAISVREERLRQYLLYESERIHCAKCREEMFEAGLRSQEEEAAGIEREANKALQKCKALNKWLQRLGYTEEEYLEISTLLGNTESRLMLGYSGDIRRQRMKIRVLKSRKQLIRVQRKDQGSLYRRPASNKKLRIPVPEPPPPELRSSVLSDLSWELLQILRKRCPVSVARRRAARILEQAGLDTRDRKGVRMKKRLQRHAKKSRL